MLWPAWLDAPDLFTLHSWEVHFVVWLFSFLVCFVLKALHPWPRSSPSSSWSVSPSQWPLTGWKMNILWHSNLLSNLCWIIYWTQLEEILVDQGKKKPFSASGVAMVVHVLLLSWFRYFDVFLFQRVWFWFRLKYQQNKLSSSVNVENNSFVLDYYYIWQLKCMWCFYFLNKQFNLKVWT